MAYSDHRAYFARMQRQIGGAALRVAAALFCTAVALGIWFLWPATHSEPSIGFIAAVVVAARFFGFGPALVCTASSASALVYFVFDPHFGHNMSPHGWERLGIFVALSVLTAGLARQKSRAERKAGEAMERMAAIVESSGDAIFSATPAGVITSWNPGAALLYGYDAAEAVGRHVSLIVPPDRAFEVVSNIARLNRGESIESYQTQGMRKDGTCVDVLMSISPLRNRQRNIIGISAIGRDITAQKRTEEILRRNERLATAGRLAATVAHEINNPLEALTNLLYLAEHDAERREEHLRSAGKEVQRLAAIAQQTLGFVREGSAPTSVNLSEIATQVLRLYTRKLEEKRIHVLTDLDESTRVYASSGELRQLFSNLVLNAIDAMRDSGTLRLRIARGRGWSSPSRTGARITIADDGAGIKPANLPHIFEPFYTTKSDLGTGLGLWVCHGIVEKYRGQIRVRSRTTLGMSGTVFSIFLPEKVANTRAA
jgi:two-component system, chemotaxis family, CheB/CheR fusion protein